MATDPQYGVAPPGHRLPAATHPGRVRLAVADLGRSVAWYMRVLGTRVLEHPELEQATERATTDSAAALGARHEDAPLIELHERPGALAVPRHGRPGLYHFAILLPSRAALGSFLRHLAELGVQHAAADHAVSEAVYLHDPDGLGIEVYADRPREEWRAAGRQLYITTAPLDVRSLVLAGGDERWEGLPAGTSMGHVHLHVGDIGKASAFYHDALGLDKVVWSYPGALFLSAGGYHHHLGLNTWAASAEPPGESDARLLDWELVLPASPDVERVERSLTSAGHVVERSDGASSVADPWGTRLRLVPQPLPKS